jgi:hypothetical protein
MIKEEKPSELQVKVLERIVRDSITNISYNHPEEELRDAVEGENPEEIRDVFRDLSYRRVLDYTPKRKFLFFDNSTYVVDLAQAQWLSDSYKEA